MLVADDETAEFGLARQDFRWVFLAFHNRPRVTVKHIKGQTQMARVIQVTGGQGVVALLPIGGGRFAGEEDLRAAVQAVLVAKEGVD